MNCSYPTTMYGSILAQIYVFFVLFTIFAFYNENLFKPKLQKNIFVAEICTSGRNTLIHSSQRTVVHVHLKICL